MDPFESAFFVLSCGRVKSELFENTDVTASIYRSSEHALGSLGFTQGHFVCLFPNFEYHSVFVWTGLFRKCSSDGQRSFDMDTAVCSFENI